MTDGPFRRYMHKGTIVLAREVMRKKVVRTDKGEIVLHPGEWEIIDNHGTTYGNTSDKFEDNYEEIDE